MADVGATGNIPAEPETKNGVSNGSSAESQSSDTAEAKSRTVLAQQRADDIAKKIVAQIEYYLGDFNLTIDAFFRDLVQKDEGWVPVETIMKCNRVKKYTTNPKDIIPSLEKFSTMFVIDDANQRIKLTQPFTGDSDDKRADRENRTVHAKRFLKTASMDAMQDYFSKFGPIEGIVLHKFQDGDAKLRGKFKGSVSVIFRNKADAEKYLAASEVETKFDGREMMRAWNKDHVEQRQKQEVEKKEQIEKSKIPGSVLHVSTQKAIDYMKIKEFFEARHPVEYVDHQRGQREARIRFKNGVAKEVLDNILSHNNNKLVIDGTQYKARVLEGKEEQAYFDTYWDTFLEARNNRIFRNMKPDQPNSQFKYQPSKEKAAKAEEDKTKSEKPEETATDSADASTAETKNDQVEKKREAEESDSPGSKKLKTEESEKSV
ncbi:lupus La protein homolog A-like [Paramacrobiotus metropolitanus]|uniref:lupus La protein homolog A-like n=1 Tax=Paramacrobiotus metropolitanus TaxID=2943436 RepID=UPI0024459980|nr:lupus La protein homolog A-like [Paramacrobiotus metropolitanus]